MKINYLATLLEILDILSQNNINAKIYLTVHERGLNAVKVDQQWHFRHIFHV
jgi:transposase-like protein